jgi:glycosyltransferase involved in cell wall biosynthesis
MKILHIQLLPHLTGVQRVSLDEMLCSRDMGLGYQYYLVAKSDGELTVRARALGVKVILCRWLARPINPYLDFFALINLVFIIRRISPDIVHTHSSKTGVLGRLAAWICRVPCIVHTVHGFAFPFAKTNLERIVYVNLERVARTITSRLIVLNSDDYKTAVNLVGFASNKVVIIPNGVNLDVFKFRHRSFGDLTFSHKNLGPQFSFAIVGRLCRQKNQIFILETIAKMDIKNRSKFEILIVGDGEDRAYLQNYVVSNGLESTVRFLGWIADMPKVLNEIDCLIVSSLWEGLSLVILEAMACGVPIIASNIPGNACVIRNLHSGLLFDLDNHQSLMECILFILRNKKGVGDIVENALTSVRENHDLRKRTDMICKVYNMRIG